MVRRWNCISQFHPTVVVCSDPLGVLLLFLCNIQSSGKSLTFENETSPGKSESQT